MPQNSPLSDAAFQNVTDWVFDLDNTLYPPGAGLFAQIEDRMTGFVMRALHVDRPKADRLRREYWRLYGTTLAGLMHEHDVEPQAFLREVHDISFAALTPDPLLRAGIAALPGRRIVFTNGSAPYAERVLAARGLTGLFDGVYGVEHASYHPKPEAAAYDAVFGQAGVRADRGAMFEDDPRNLTVPHARGMQTVLVGDAPADDAHIDRRTHDLTAFLTALTRG